MATADDLRRLALSLEGTVAAPHFDRTAFRVARIFATLAPDGLTANLKLSPEEQEFQCLLRPAAFAPVPNAWGAQGWTTATLAAVDEAELRAALEQAWRHAVPRPKTRRR
jgi:hypothetical protein